MPPTKYPRPHSSESSSSDDRILSVVKGIEDSLRDLFDGRDNEFVVTNDFIDQLIESTAKILRAAIKDQNEESLFSVWKENMEKYREVMLQVTERTRLRGSGDDVKI